MIYGIIKKAAELTQVVFGFFLKMLMCLQLQVQVQLLVEVSYRYLFLVERSNFNPCCTICMFIYKGALPSFEPT